jgi:hypothetical protein
MERVAFAAWGVIRNFDWFALLPGMTIAALIGGQLRRPRMTPLV